MQVRERRSEKRAPSKRGKPRGNYVEAKKLTSSMAGAKSAEEFVKILNAAVDGPIFNYFHASCAYHRLATWKRSGKLAKAAGGLKLSKLNARVQEMIEEGQLHARELANVLWSFDYLFDEYPNVLVLVPAIVAQVPDKAKDMKPQELSNVLLAAAKLKDDEPDVVNVVPAIVAQVPDKAKDMTPQALSNVLWAAAKLKDDEPDVVNVVPAIVAQVPDKAKDMKPQGLSNVLLAAAKLKDDAPDMLNVVSVIVAQVPDKAKDMKPQGLSNVLLAAAKLKDDAPDMLNVVSVIVAQVPDKAKDMKPQELSNVLWAAARLQDDATDMLNVVPAIVAQVPDKAKDMNSQGLSNVLLAAAKLKDDARDVLDLVPAIVVEVPDKAKDMIPQELSNSLLALVLLQDSVPGVSSFLRGGSGSNTGFVGEAASRVVKLLPKLSDLDLFLTPPTVVWACAKMELPHDELLSAVAKRFASQKTISSLSDWGLCALYGSYQLVDSTDRFTDLAEMLKKELTRRGLSDSDVGWSLEGPLNWAYPEK